MSDLTPTERRLLPGLRRDNLVTELLAGVTLVAVSVPLNIGYAQIAGLPAQAGLYALVLPSLVFALTASSRQVVVAPDAAASALVASSLVGLGVAGGTGEYAAMAAAQAIVGGVLFLLCARLRLGFLANFLSHPVLVGFVGGLALEITVSQVAKMLGLQLGHGGFFDQLRRLVTSLDETHLLSTVLALVCLAVLVGGRRLSRRAPWALVVMVGATLAAHLFDLSGRGVAVLGEVPSGLPPLAFPDLDLGTWLLLVPSATALTAITVAEGLMVARAYADRHGQPHAPDRDLAAYGLANIGAGLTGGLTVGSSTSRTAAVDEAGARSQLPAIVLAVSAVLLLAFGAEALAGIPSPAIGATVLVAVSRLLGVAELRHLWHHSRDELAVAAVCFVSVLALGPLQGLLVAFVLALVNLTRRAAVPHGVVLTDPRQPPPAEGEVGSQHGGTAPGVVVLRLGGPLFFANARALTELVERTLAGADGPVRHLVLDVESVTDVDTTAAQGLTTMQVDLASRGTTLHLSRVTDGLADRLAELELFSGVATFRTNREALDRLDVGPDAG
ncbi:MAG: SulP family inorganic anion transporter [Nocardioides sp.]|uniref:SulP family inorganic anion transporter n=1 Tax=Nocardioides sp. TaxID=35761 RepID=UPI003F0BDDC4